tara:strand:+ start:673 stop:1086 length:414 start_codon:yes stop_codon:yes gene_type:complete
MANTAANQEMKCATHTTPRELQCLSVAAELESVGSLPLGAAGRSALGVLGALANQTTILLASASKTTQLTVLVDRVHNPVNARVNADSLVGRIDKDNLIELVGGVLKITTYIYPLSISGVNQRRYSYNFYHSTWQIQ